MNNVLDENLTVQARNNLYMGSEREMLWHCHADPRFSYFTYIPEKAANDPSIQLGVMSFIHGTGRTVEEYRELFKPFADENNLALIFPLFPGGLYDKDDFNSYKLLAYGDIRYDDIFLKMVDELSERYPNINSEKILLYGWSGGGQFVQRFLYTHPERLKGLVIGAPGRITYLDSDKDFYWGTRNFSSIFGKSPDIDAIRKVPIMLLIGEKDVLFVGEADCGNTRMERLIALKRNFEEHGIAATMQIIPGIGHKGDYPVKASYVIDFFRDVLLHCGEK